MNCFLCFPDERQKIVINRLVSDAFIKVLQKRIYISPITVIKYFKIIDEVLTFTFKDPK